MTHTGYAMVDCTGLNLNTSSEQTITGIYAMSGMPCTPCSVIAWMEGTTIVATGHVLRVSITSADKVTVTNLVAG